MPAREPDLVPHAVVEGITVTRGHCQGCRVQHSRRTEVFDAVARVHHAPGEVDALVDEAELLRPAAHLLEHAPRHRDGALPDGGHLAAARGVAHADPRHPVARRATAVARDHAQLCEPELRVRRRTGTRRARARRARRARRRRRGRRAGRRARARRPRCARPGCRGPRRARRRGRRRATRSAPSRCRRRRRPRRRPPVAASESSARRSSSGRRPVVRTTQPMAVIGAGRRSGSPRDGRWP